MKIRQKNSRYRMKCMNAKGGEKRKKEGKKKNDKKILFQLKLKLKFP